jgi:hypothetical protein
VPKIRAGAADIREKSFFYVFADEPSDLLGAMLGKD